MSNGDQPSNHQRRSDTNSPAPPSLQLPDQPNTHNKINETTATDSHRTQQQFNPDSSSNHHYQPHQSVSDSYTQPYFSQADNSSHLQSSQYETVDQYPNEYRDMDSWPVYEHPTQRVTQIVYEVSHAEHRFQSH
jgi:hypothetical protein